MKHRNSNWEPNFVRDEPNTGGVMETAVSLNIINIIDRGID